MRIENTSDPVYAPNDKSDPQADGKRHPRRDAWTAGDGFIRAAHTRGRGEGDLGQACALAGNVKDDGQRATGWCPPWPNTSASVSPGPCCIGS